MKDQNFKQIHQLFYQRSVFFVKKRKTKNKSTEALTLYIDDRAITTIKTAAEKKNDYLIIIIPDLIASETHYHSSCYRQNCKINYAKETTGVDENEHEHEKEAYREVVTFCIELANDPDVVPVSELITMMAKKLEKNGKELSTSWKKNFSRKF